MARKNGRKPPRLSLCMTVKDCARTLEPLLKTMKPYVDEVVIVLGGVSSDRTPQIAKRYADLVIPFEWHDDWSAARNEALKHVTAPYWIWLDGDDEVQNPERLPHLLDAMDKRGWGRCDLTYLYDFDEHGNPTVVHQRERIMRTALDWHWEDRVHETCHTAAEHVIGYSDEMTVIHRRPADAGSSSERNLPILLEMLAADPKPRTLLHLGHAYFSLARYDEAQRYYELYLERPEDDLNQWNAAMMAARCSFMRQDWLGVQSWCMAALAVLPQFKDPYIFLAHATFWTTDDTDQAEAWLRSADGKDDAPLAVFRNPLDYTVNRWDIEHRLHARRSRFKEALECCQMAYAVQPNMRWQELVRYYQEAVRAETSIIAATHLTDHLLRRGDVVRASQFLSYLLPQTIREDPRIIAVKQRIHSFLEPVTVRPKEAYETVDNIDITGDLSSLPRVQFYIDRLRARGAKRVLEVGCHNGDVSRLLAQAGFEVTGLDISAPAIAKARELAGDIPNLHFVEGELRDVREPYDAVLFAEVLEHLTPQKQVEHLQRADDIAPMVLGSVPAEFLAYGKGLWEYDPQLKGHIFEFDQTDLETLILTEPVRHIVNCHKVLDPGAFMDSPGFGNRVFEYDRQRPQGLGIAFYVGPAWEHWTPDSIDAGGLGGSETAVARLAEDLAARGHLVSVFATESGEHNGVVYRHHSKFDPKDERDVLIVSRQPWLLAERPNAARVLLWCHDVDYGARFTPEIAANLDAVVVMSEWQREHWRTAYPWLDEARLNVAGNAITPYEITASERHRHRFIFTSSADRGLDELLGIWPRIIEMWPDAELHVFYGFNYLSGASRVRPELAAYMASVVRQARQPGVVLRGRVGQHELAEELARAQFWLYPSMTPGGGDWCETFCINALEAQAYNCIPVTRPVAALVERIGIPECFLEDWTEDAVLERLHWWDTQSPEAWPFAGYARRYEHTWPAIADLWERLLLAPVPSVGVPA